MNTPNLGLAFRIGFVFALILLLTLLSPRTAVFKYEFAEGKPWVYNDLIAEFSFPIKKSLEEIEEEKSKIKNETLPYFSRDNSIELEEVGKIQERLPSVISLNKAVLKEEGIDSSDIFASCENILNEIYAKGIIDESLEEINISNEGKIIYLEGHVAELKSLSSFQNMEKAREKLNSFLTDAKLGSFIGPLLERSLVPNINYSDSITKKILEENLAEISINRGSVQEGQLIVEKGDIVTKERKRILDSLRGEYSHKVIGIRQARMVGLGHFIINGLILGLFLIYLAIFENYIFQNFRHLAFVFLLVVIGAILTFLINSSGLPLMYIIPFCIVPILLRMYFGPKLAFFGHLSVILIAVFISSASLGFTFIQLMGGLAAIIANNRARYWSQFFAATLWLWVAYMVGYLGISLIEGSDFENIVFANFGWLSVSAFLTMIAYPLIPLIEKVFGFISPITLIELSDLNKPLLKKLSIEAPGTFQHSLQVANLAEAAAFELEANELLVRVGALYHDIGKLDNPAYFIENQQSDYNPHDSISHKESAAIIIGHVTKGVELAKKYKLPKAIVEFIRTHHGDSRVEYFYQSYVQEEGEAKVDDDEFRYPGPKPQSLESAILMLADSVEAAARSIDKPDMQSLSDLVDQIVSHKIDQDQLSEAKVTFYDLSVCKGIFKKMLNSIYHVRISYPEGSSEKKKGDLIEKLV